MPNFQQLISFKAHCLLLLSAPVRAGGIKRFYVYIVAITDLLYISCNFTDFILVCY